MKPLKVLIVEDNPLVALDLEQIVASAPAAEVTVSATAANAQEMCGSELDVALLDVDVLDGTTFELARKLMRQGVAFIFVSASNPRDVPPDLCNAPFIAKPYDPTRLMQQVRRSSTAPAPWNA